MSEPTPELLKRIDQDRLHQARMMSPVAKAMAGVELYDAILQRMGWGVRHDHPELNEAEVRDRVIERIREYRSRRDADGK